MTDETFRGETDLPASDELGDVRLDELSGPLQEACARAGWKSLVPVQARAIPYLLARRDVMIQSRTGSGKTGAYLLPIMQNVDVEKKAAQALVLVPTRELRSTTPRWWS